MQRIGIILSFFLLLLTSAVSYALPFNIVTKSNTQLPTSIQQFTTATAYYTVTNNTGSQRKNNYVKYLPPNITQVTSGGTYSDTCGATFNLAANAQSGDSCTLQLTISGNVNSQDSDPHHHLFVCFPGGVTCAGTQNSLNVGVATLSSIAITPTSATLAEGITQQFTAIGTYTDGSARNITASVTWHSSNTAAATIASTGKATTIIAGTTTITATLGTVTSNSATLTVTNATLSSIAIVPPSASLAAGLTQQYTAVGKYSDDSTVDITASVTWISSNTSVATIVSGGLATTHAAGTANITATLSGKTSNTATLTVTTATLSSISITPTSPSVAAGLTQQFTAMGTYSDGTTVNITSLVSWASATPSVATIASGGLATTLAAGTTSITATLSGKTSNAATLTVTSATLSSIAIIPTSTSLAAGLTQQYTAVGTYSDNSTLDITTSVTWISSNTSIATILSGGLATTHTAGTANITATLSGKTSNSATLTVTSATLVSIATTPTGVSLAAGLTQQFTATGTYTDGTTVNITSSVTWTSATPSVATIASGGLATTIAAGTTNITATLSGVTSPTNTLTVTAATLSSITVTPTTASIAAGLTQQYTATGTYSDSSTLDITNSVIWSSSNTSVATIVSGGLATTHTAGTSNITATLSGVTSTPVVLTVTTATLVSIAVTPTNPSLAVGLTRQFTATGTYTDNSTVDLTALATWNSATPSVATIVSSGLATAVAIGTTNITASLSGVTSPAQTLTVIAATLQSIAITPTSANLAVGLKQQFTAVGTYSDTSTLDITASVVWHSSNTSAATIVTGGLASTVAVGSTNITATLSGKTSNSAPFTVTAPPVTIPAGANYCAVLSNTTITNAGATVVTGNMCLSPPGVSITGFPPGTINNGAQHIGDATAITAHADTVTLFNALNGLTCDFNEPAVAELGGQTLTPGVYCFPSSAAITGVLTLSGAGNYVFIIGTTLTTAVNGFGQSDIVLTNGALSTNVYWNVGTAATLGASTTLKGRVITTTATTFGSGATLLGSVTSTGAGITLDLNTITQQAF